MVYINYEILTKQFHVKIPRRQSELLQPFVTLQRHSAASLEALPPPDRSYSFDLYAGGGYRFTVCLSCRESLTA